jgi:hypothetical protein
VRSNQTSSGVAWMVVLTLKVFMVSSAPAV